MKYKVGDSVRVVGDLEEREVRFLSPGVVEEIANLRGTIVTITGTNGGMGYQINGDHRKYIWSEAMFSEIIEFTKDDLETRMVVETRDKCRYLVLRDKVNIHLMNANGNTCIRNSQGFGPRYDENMKNGNPDKDILKVFPKVNTFEEVKTVNGPIWERKEPKKMTVAEIQKELGYGVEVIADAKR